MKEVIKKLGLSVIQKLLDRISYFLGVIIDLMKVFDFSLLVFKRLGKYIKKFVVNDIEKIVKELVVNKVFICILGRKYNFYLNMKLSILCGFNLQKMFNWISDYKKYMILNRRVR